MEFRSKARGGGRESSCGCVEGWGCESGTRSVAGEESAGAGTGGGVCGFAGAAFSLLLLSGGTVLVSVDWDGACEARCWSNVPWGPRGMGNTLYTIWSSWSENSVARWHPYNARIQVAPAMVKLWRAIFL